MAEARRVRMVEDDPKMAAWGSREDLEMCGPGRAVLYGGFGDDSGAAGVLRGVVAMSDLGEGCVRHVLARGMVDGGGTVRDAVEAAMAAGVPAGEMDEDAGADAGDPAALERPVVVFSGLDGTEIQRVIGGMKAAGVSGVAYCMAVPNSVDRPLSTVLGEVLDDFNAAASKPQPDVQPDESKAAVLGPNGELLPDQGYSP